MRRIATCFVSAVLAALVSTGCSLVVDFDRRLLVDGGTGSNDGAIADGADGGSDAGADAGVDDR